MNRIENVELEFVTFDAHDVIVTSGPGFGQSMLTHFSTIVAYNKDVYKGTDITDLELSGQDPTRPAPDRSNVPDILVNSSGGLNGFYKNKWGVFDITTGDRYMDRSYEYENKPAGDYFLADSVALIKQWMKSNGIQ